MIGDNETNFPHKLLSTNRQVSNLCKVFANHLSKYIKLSKTQLGRFLGPLLKTGLPLIKNVIEPLAKSVLISLGLTAAASAADAGIHKKLSESRNMTTVIISNDEVHDIIKIVKSLEDSGLLVKGVTETVQNEVKEQKEGFLGMLLGTLGESLLGNLLTGRTAIETGQGQGIYRAGKGKIC